MFPISRFNKWCPPPLCNPPPTMCSQSLISTHPPPQPLDCVPKLLFRRPLPLFNPPPLTSPPCFQSLVLINGGDVAGIWTLCFQVQQSHDCMWSLNLKTHSCHITTTTPTIASIHHHGAR
jgi:hypothetical protein